MKNLVLPAFGENVISDIKTNETARAVIIGDVDESVFEKYCTYFKNNGFCEKENRKLADNLFASFLTAAGCLSLILTDLCKRLTVAGLRKTRYCYVDSHASSY